MALTQEQEAALDGAWALRYCASRLRDLNGNNDPSVKSRIQEMHHRAGKLDDLAAEQLPKVNAR